MIELKSVSKKIGEQWVLKDVDLTLDQGKIYGFQGRNGSGKTMLFRAITGLIHLTEGEVYINNKKVDVNHIPVNVGLLLENPTFLKSMTGRDNLKMISLLMEDIGDQEIVQALQAVGLSEVADKAYGKYSMGMKQRLGIAAAILGEPALIILDEPTVALDEEGIELLHGLMRHLQSKGATILISSHEKEIIEQLTDEVIYMRSGKITDKSLVGFSGDV